MRILPDIGYISRKIADTANASHANLRRDSKRYYLPTAAAVFYFRRIGSRVSDNSKNSSGSIADSLNNTDHHDGDLVCKSFSTQNIKGCISQNTALYQQNNLHNYGDFVDIAKLIGRDIVAVKLFAVENDFLYARFNVGGVVNSNIQLLSAEILVNLKSVPLGRN